MDWKWSKIQRTNLATEAFVRMCENEIKGCSYHNLSHIESMYNYLEETNHPYDEALDWAIMFHDVVYDAEPNKELRSAKFFFDMNQQHSGCNLDINGIDRVQFLIMETSNHLVTNDVYLKGSSAIIRADLHALTSKFDTVNNFTKIMNESMELYKCSIEDFAMNNISFMDGLRKRMDINIRNVDSEDKLFYYCVKEGIELTMNMANVIISNGE